MHQSHCMMLLLKCVALCKYWLAHAHSSPQVLWHSNPVCIETNDIKSSCNPDPETVLIGDFNSKPAPRGGAVEYLNKSNPPYAPPNPYGG